MTGGLVSQCFEHMTWIEKMAWLTVIMVIYDWDWDLHPLPPRQTSSAFSNRDATHEKLETILSKDKIDDYHQYNQHYCSLVLLLYNKWYFEMVNNTKECDFYMTNKTSLQNICKDICN